PLWDEIRQTETVPGGLEALGETRSQTETVLEALGDAIRQTETPPYDIMKFHLGSLCKRQHDYLGSGKSLRRIVTNTCLECERETGRERYRGGARKPAPGGA